MGDTPVKRKLIGILSADVKAYSRLMETDEIGTLQTLKQYRDVIADCVDEYDGRVVDSPGDNILAAFASVVAATQCAIKIQQEIVRRNDRLPEDQKMRFRIGINLGDVIQDGNGIYGDGVNIAARVEALAEADGICISGSVYEQVKNKLPLAFDYLGNRIVKNISDPVSVYRVIRRTEAGAGPARIRSRIAGLNRLKASNRPLPMNVAVTCVAMMLLMPFINHANINLLTKIWQCRVALLPNSQKVTVITIGPTEHKKMNIEAGEEEPPPYLSNPKIWRRYHPKVLKTLRNLGAEAVGFDFWFSPAYDAASKSATKTFVEGLTWARINNLPVVLGQAQNDQDAEIYAAADWGSISLQMDLTWLDNVMYLKSWDMVNISNDAVKKPAMFVQVLAKKLRLVPEIDGRGVHLIGKRIPLRLWLSFAQTPFKAVPYHEIYNGWADNALFSGRIVLIGLSDPNTDYFKTPYSPRDFTPDHSDDSYGMPGVFLYAHAVNQIMNGYYHREVNDEWFGFVGGSGFSAVALATLAVLMLEIILTCLVLYGAKSLIRKRASVKSNLILMSMCAAALITLLAMTPILFGLANFLVASLIFIALTAGRIEAGRI